MTLRGVSTPSCSACKHRRRKCTATCPLAKYFPADKPELFQYVHRLYGVSSVTKILKTLETQDQKDDAMKSIIFESEWRHRIPAYGCSFIICHLNSQLKAAGDELRRMQEFLAASKYQSHQRVDHNTCYQPSSQQEFGGCRPRIDSQDVEGTESVPFPFFLNEDGGIYAESPENVARPVLGLDLRSDVTSNHNLLSTHLEAQTSVHGIQRPEILFPDYDGLPYSTTAGGIYAESPENVARPVLGSELHSDVTSNHNLLSMHLEAQTSVHGIQREPEIFFPDYGGLPYSTTAGGIYAESPENVARPVLGSDLRSDVTSNHNLLSMHLEAQTSVHGIHREPEIFFPDYGGPPYSTTAGGIYAESPENVARPVLGSDLRSDVTSNHNLLSTHLEAQTSVHGTEPEIFFPDYGGLPCRLT